MPIQIIIGALFPINALQIGITYQMINKSRLFTGAFSQYAIFLNYIP